MSEYTGVVSFGDTSGGLGYPNYATLQAACSAVPSGGAIVIAPGSYTLTAGVDINKSVDIIGVDSVSLLAPSKSDHAAIFGISGGSIDVLFENVQFAPSIATHVHGELGLIEWNGCPGAAQRVTFNACTIQSVSLMMGALYGGVYGSCTGTHPPVAFHHCRFNLYASDRLFRWTNLANIRITRCISNLANVSGVQSINSLPSPDYVTTNTPYYGPTWYWPMHRLPEHALTGRAMDLMSVASPRVTLFEWGDPQTARHAILQAQGHWHSPSPLPGREYGIYYLSQDNRCPPIIHGPYTAE